MNLKYIVPALVIAALIVVFIGIKIQGNTLSASRQLTEAARACRDQSNRSLIIGCMKKKLTQGVETRGPAPYMQALDNNNKEPFFDGPTGCHDVAHVVGQLGLTYAETHHKPLAFCSASVCGDGCWHGALEAYVARGGTLSGAVQTLCASIPADNERNSAACYHGIGHGIANLIPTTQQAITTCDILPRDKDRWNCGVGVFMEHFQSSSFATPVAAVPDDIPAFCRSFPPLYEDVCSSSAGVYSYQARRNDGVAASVCAAVATPFREGCMMAFAQAILNETGDIEKTLNRCALLPQHAACSKGIVLELTLLGRFTDAFAACSRLPAITDCYQFVGQKIGYAYGKPKQQEVCNTLQDTAKQACLAGNE